MKNVVLVLGLGLGLLAGCAVEVADFEDPEVAVTIQHVDEGMPPVRCAGFGASGLAVDCDMNDTTPNSSTPKSKTCGFSGSPLGQAVVYADLKTSNGWGQYWQRSSYCTFAKVRIYATCYHHLDGDSYLESKTKDWRWYAPNEGWMYANFCAQGYHAIDTRTDVDIYAWRTWVN